MDSRSVRCRDCNVRYAVGENAPGYIHGRGQLTGTCKCGKWIARHAEMCWGCRAVGRYTDSNGYIMLTQKQGHPNANSGGLVREHVFVMSEYLGRGLIKGETVHHINLNRADNRLENLQLRIGQHGPGSVYLCGDCGSDKLMPKPIADEELNRK